MLKACMSEIGRMTTEELNSCLRSRGFDMSRPINRTSDPDSYRVLFEQRDVAELDEDWRYRELTPKTIVTLDEEINKYGDDVPIVNNDTPKSEYTKWAKDAHKSCLSKLYEWFRGEVFDEPDKRKSEKEPDWFRNRHCSMAEFREKHGK